ncbi:hypothetical protein [Mycobacterium sp. E2733]|uniref:hypothetical protein n=1 Tax=Mycobacterium sp. E2733 TaxID=1834138 RepID=UPI0008008771|nr:hypothetical protein [Mycobacterium sp. E2733]OBH92529.1 hypothetical protein A5678_08710 [Mycobacterium sp. E2733]
MSYSQLPDLECCGGDEDCLLHRLRAILEKAAGISGHFSPGAQIFPSGKILAPGIGVRFPSQQIIAVERVGMWVGGGNVCLAMWPGELRPQYACLYSDPNKVEALIALAENVGWALHPNFHLAYRFARVQQRWYPARKLPGPTYLRQWIDDFHDGRAGARYRDHLVDPDFRRWLVVRGYAQDDDLPSLDVWIHEQSPKRQFHIRPGVEVAKTWQFEDAVALDREGAFIAEVRATIDQIFGALGEPQLSTIHSQSTRGSDTVMFE